MIFRQLFDPRSSTYTYLLGDPDSRQAVLIDSVYEQFQRDAALIDELRLRLLYTLETHVHADHVTAASLMRERFASRIAVSRRSGASGADRLVDDGDVVQFGAGAVEVRATPGHTDGCVTYVTSDHKMAFTGDALLIRGSGRTDFQQGDPRKLYRSVHDKIFTLPDDTLLYPGHDYAGRMCTSVAEEKEYNPRLGGRRSEGDFIGFMENLGLPHPKQIDVAVPANLECGRPLGAAVGAAPPSWAPVVRTYAGVPELSPQWVRDHLGEIRSSWRLIDVREEEEFNGELGHIDGAELVPLATLGEALSDGDRSACIVTICRSGGRSAQAALLLEKRGFERVANLAGGMIRWRDLEEPR